MNKNLELGLSTFIFNCGMISDYFPQRARIDYPLLTTDSLLPTDPWIPFKELPSAIDEPPNNAPFMQRFEADPLLIFGGNTCTTVAKIINVFRNGDKRWITLLAQMQSGKTDCYLLTASEWLRGGMVENVVIFSGNAEIDLRDQLLKEVNGNGGSKFYDKYTLYLEQMGIDTRVICEIIRYVKDHIRVVWGTKLKQYSGPVSNTLFIWEESHYAQSIHNCPAQFLTTAGLCATGDMTTLKSQGNYVISVSATPFSELCDLYNYNQHVNKELVYMPPGNNYTSVKNIRDSGRLHFYTNIQIALISALTSSKSKSNSTYGIVRVTAQNEALVKSTIQQCGYDYVTYDSLTTGTEREKGIRVWNGMANPPIRPTVIGIREKCRMGQNLQKMHISFVFETAKISNTDTVLQGLLGRTCGYSDGSERIHVWVNKSCEDEINKYVTLTDHLNSTTANANANANGEVNATNANATNTYATNSNANGGVNAMVDENALTIPCRATNVEASAASRKSLLHPIIPIQITVSSTQRTTMGNEVIRKLYQLRDGFRKDATTQLVEGVENKNEMRDIVHLIRDVVRPADPKKGGIFANIKCRNLFNEHNEEKKTYVGVYHKLVNDLQNGQRARLGTGCGIDKSGTELNIWIAGNNTVYITAHVVAAASTQKITTVPETTKKEVFAVGLNE